MIGDKYFDSRDVIERITELERQETDELNEAELREEGNPDAEAEGYWLDEDDAAELKALRELAEECEGYGDWQYGVTFIRDDQFEEYAQEFARDIGAIGDEMYSWPLNNLDWKGAAEDLQQDFTSVEFDGRTYWYR